MTDDYAQHLLPPLGRPIALAIIILVSCWCIIIGSRQSLTHWTPMKRTTSTLSVLLINKRVAALIPILISVMLFVSYVNSDRTNRADYSAKTHLLAQVVAVHVPVWLSTLALQSLLYRQFDQWFSCKCLLFNLYLKLNL